MTLELPVHSRSDNSFFQENIYFQYALRLRTRHCLHKGWHNARGGFALLELTPGRAPGLLNTRPHTASTWAPHHRSPQQLLRTGKWLLLLWKFLPISIRRKALQHLKTHSRQEKKLCFFFSFFFFLNASCTQSRFYSCTNMNRFTLVVTIKSFTIAVLLMFVELIWIHSISVIIPTSD